MRVLNKNILKIIFNIRHDKYEFIAILFEFINIFIIFQLIINNIFKFYLNKFILIYLNDILIYFDILKNYKKYLNIIFKKIKKKRILYKIKKI